MILFLRKLGLASPPPLRGRLVVLQPFRMRHRRVIRDWFKNEDLLRLAFGISTDGETLLRIGREFIGDILFSSRELFMVSLPDHALVGLVSFAINNDETRTARIGILIADERNRGKGYGKDALKALLRHLFTERGVGLVELDTATFNEQAQRCFQSCGFRKTGELSEIDFKSGQSANKVKMGMTREEYLSGEK
jgi:RimJ/RimL family protein N-acetyltransferase